MRALTCGKRPIEVALTDRSFNPRRSLIFGFAWSSCQLFWSLLTRFRSLLGRDLGLLSGRFLCQRRTCRFSAWGPGRQAQNRRWRRSLSTPTAAVGREPTDTPDRAPAPGHPPQPQAAPGHAAQHASTIRSLNTENGSLNTYKGPESGAGGSYEIRPNAFRPRSCENAGGANCSAEEIAAGVPRAALRQAHGRSCNSPRLALDYDLLPVWGTLSTSRDDEKQTNQQQSVAVARRGHRRPAERKKKEKRGQKKKGVRTNGT